jgi:hypothetical protein
MPIAARKHIGTCTYFVAGNRQATRYQCMMQWTAMRIDALLSGSELRRDSHAHVLIAAAGVGELLPGDGVWPDKGD